jgi:hypothetical protein
MGAGCGLWPGEGQEEGAGRRQRQLPVSSSRTGTGRRGRRGALTGRGREEAADNGRWPTETPYGMARDGGTTGSGTSRRPHVGSFS